MLVALVPPPVSAQVRCLNGLLHSDQLAAAFIEAVTFLRLLFRCGPSGTLLELKPYGTGRKVSSQHGSLKMGAYPLKVHSQAGFTSADTD